MTYVLVVLDLVPRSPVTASVPNDLWALRQLVEVGTGTDDGNTDNAESQFSFVFARHGFR